MEPSRSATANTTRAGRKVTQPTGYRAFIPASMPPACNGHKALEHLYVHPIVSVNEVQEMIGTTYPAANDLVAKIIESGILHEITGQSRNRRFGNEGYIRLFHEQPAEAGT